MQLNTLTKCKKKEAKDNFDQKQNFLKIGHKLQILEVGFNWHVKNRQALRGIF